MAQVTLPYTLTAGTPENVANLMSNLNALKDGVNTIDTAQIASGAVSQAKLAAGVYVPIGGIVQYGGSTAPSNWLICNGDAVSRTTYADLFTALGTSYGSGNGSSTFNLPNLKGKIGVGFDSSQTEFDSLSDSGGAKTHTLTTTEMPSHTHDFYGDDFSLASGSVGGYMMGDVYGQSSSLRTSAPGSGLGNANTGGGGAHNNLQPYIVVNYIIRAL